MANPVVAFFGATEFVNALMNLASDAFVKPAEQDANQYTLNYERNYARENEQYWKEYEKNTGKTARYPYRSGVNYDLSTFYNTQRNIRESYASTGRMFGSALYGAGLYKYGGRKK